MQSEYASRTKIFDIRISCSGPIQDIKEVEVTIGTCSYQFMSLIEAVDLAFKASKVLYHSVPLCSRPCWTFLENFIYEFEDVQSLACVMSLKDKLSRLNEERLKRINKVNSQPQKQNNKRSKNAETIQNKSLRISQ